MRSRCFSQDPSSASAVHAAALPWIVLQLALVASTSDPLWAQTDPSTVDLRPHFVAGRTCVYHVWSQRQQTQTVVVGPHSRTFQTILEVDSQVTWTVERVRSDGSARCRMTVEWMTAQYTPPNGKAQESDSRRTTGQPKSLHRLLRVMAGLPAVIEVDADGTVMDVSGIEAIRRSAPADVTIPDELDFMESASDLATIAGVPAHTAVNDAWETHFRWNHQLGKMHQAMRYRLQSIEQIAGIPIATITGTATLRLEPDADRLPKPTGPDVRSRARLTEGGVQTQVVFDLLRHEAIGRHTVEHRVIEVEMRWAENLITRKIDQEIRSQVLRVAERGQPG